MTLDQASAAQQASHVQQASEVQQARTTGLHPAVGAATVFIASAAVLVLEIVAMRLVAPYIGITLQTSSAVIGVALSAMALGAWTGGRLADRRDAERLLAPVLVAAGVLAAATVPLVRLAGEHLQGSSSAGTVLVLAVLAVFAPSALLSTVTPIVVKTQLADLGRTGSTVGRLSGIATLGAITATFLTGFVLLGAFRSSAIVLGTGGLLVVTGLALLVRRPDGRTVAAAAVAVPLVPWLFLAAPNPCQFETDYHCAGVVETPPGSSTRELRLDTLAHGLTDLDDPTQLGYAYLQAMAAALDGVREPGTKAAGLYLGAGAMSLPRYLAATRPGSHADVLEIDPGVVRIDRDYLGGATVPGVGVRYGDGRTLVRRTPRGRYDVVVGDAFGGVAVPWHLTTLEAASDLRDRLAPDGVYVLNLVDSGRDAFARAEVATLRRVFPHVAIAADRATLSGAPGSGGNHVVMASMRPLPVGRITGRLQRTAPLWRLLDEPATAAFAGAAQVLTDDFAPVDQLFTPFDWA